MSNTIVKNSEKLIYVGAVYLAGKEVKEYLRSVTAIDEFGRETTINLGSVFGKTKKEALESIYEDEDEDDFDDNYEDEDEDDFDDNYAG